MKVYKTNYDGYIISVEKNKIVAAEGVALCSKRVKGYLKNNDPIELDMFCNEAISYGYCK